MEDLSFLNQGLIHTPQSDATLWREISYIVQDGQRCGRMPSMAGCGGPFYPVISESRKTTVFAVPWFAGAMLD
jgi:hypothetical protein